jgi:hypothetical protein
MSELVEGFRSVFPFAASDEEFASYAAEDDVKKTLVTLAESGCSSLGKLCYVFGTGHQPRSTYTQMDGLDGIHVVTYERSRLYCDGFLAIEA